MELLSKNRVIGRVVAVAILAALPGTIPVLATEQGARGQSQSTTSVLAQARRALTSGQPALALRLVDPLLVKSPGDKELVTIGIQAALAIDNASRALSIYDTFVQAAGVPSAEVLKPIALRTLNDVVSGAATDPRLRAEGLERLARDGDARASGSLRQEGQVSQTRLALIADASLARLGDDSAMKRIAARISAADDLPKTAEAEAAVRAGKPELAPLLVPLLKNRDPYTRATAVEGLGALGYKTAVEDIRPLLSDPFVEVRTKAGLAMARLGDSAGRDLVATMLRSPVTDVKLAAIEAGGSTMGPERLVILRSIMTDRDPLNRIRAAEAVAPDDPGAALAVLVQLTQHADTLVRREAGRVLEGFTPVDLELARRLIVDSEAWVRMYGAGAVLRAARR